MRTRGVEAPGFDLSQCKTGEDANNIVQCRVVATGNSVDAVWEQLLRGYTRPRVRAVQRLVDTGCGPATSDVGPFYCPVDQTAYFDTDFFEVLRDPVRFQRWPVRAGVRRRPRVRPSRAEPAGHARSAHSRAPQGATGSGVRTELQADCYAGVWAHYAAITKQEGTDVTFLEPLSDKDIADALSAAASVGDDRIQKQATGPGQSRGVDARLLRATAEVVHRRDTGPATRTSATPSPPTISDDFAAS